MRFCLIKARQSVDLIEVRIPYQPHHPTNKKSKKTTANESSANSDVPADGYACTPSWGGGAGNWKRVAHGERGRFLLVRTTRKKNAHRRSINTALLLTA